MEAEVLELIRYKKFNNTGTVGCVRKHVDVQNMYSVLVSVEICEL